MTEHRHVTRVSGPWSLATSRQFWEGFTPAPLASPEQAIETTFLIEADWSTATARVTQPQPDQAHLVLKGDGDLDAGAEQVERFLSLDIDATEWPAVGRRDPVIADAQAQLSGLRPCGFHSPYEAAAWAVLSQRLRIPQAAALRRDLTQQHGRDGAFPTPDVLAALKLDLPARKLEYLHAVAAAAHDGLLHAPTLRAIHPADALRELEGIHGIGPFAADLILIRGANHPDVLPRNERRLVTEITKRYGPDAESERVAQQWRPFRSWASVHLRALAERT